MENVAIKPHGHHLTVEGEISTNGDLPPTWVHFEVAVPAGQTTLVEAQVKALERLADAVQAELEMYRRL